MARPRKYKTDEERRAARRQSRRKYYESHIQNERKRALERYHSHRDRERKARAVKREELVPEPVLPNTAAMVGYLSINEDYNLESFALALQSDLERWTDGKPELEVWEDLVSRLIAVQGKPRLSKAILLDVARKSQIAEQVLEQAEIGQREAWLRRDRRRQAAFDNLSHKAKRVHEGLLEMVSLYHESPPVLQDLYDEDALVWQCT